MPDVQVNGSFTYGRVVQKVLVGDGVAVFWLIAGMFLFGKKDYKSVLKHTYEKVCIPLILFSAFLFYFNGWLWNDMSIASSFCRSAEDYKHILHSLLRVQNGVSGFDHGWYLYVYCMAMIAFPVLNSFISYVDDKKVSRTAAIMCFGILLLNDVTLNEMGSFSHHSFNALIPASILMTLGHMFYQNRERVIKKAPAAGFLILYLGITLLRSWFQLQQYRTTGNTHLLFWYTFPGVISALCMICICIKAADSLHKTAKVNYFIQELSSYTFGIYIIHCLVIGFLGKANILNWFWFTRQYIKNDTVNIMIFTLFSSIAVFTVSLFTLCIIRMLRSCLVYNLKKETDQHKS